jgi:SAM-dependent methyltransferase
MESPKKLDLGCGPWKKEGFFGIDLVRMWEQPNGKPPLVVQADIFHDLNDGIPFPDNSTEEIYCSHFLEHVQEPKHLLREIYRVCQKDAIVEIKIPLFELRFREIGNIGNYVILKEGNAHILEPCKLMECSPDHITAFYPTWFEKNLINDLKDKFEIKEKFFVNKQLEGKIMFFEMTIVLRVLK